MILSHKRILTLLKQKKLTINPLDTSLIGPASINMRLGNNFRTFNKQNKPVQVNQDIDVTHYTNLVRLKEKETITLQPGEMILGQTLEHITLPENVVGRIDGKSRFARIGLIVHLSSSFIQPASNNVQVLEIANLSPNELVLKPGLVVCQVVLEELKGKERYKGAFATQKTV